MTMAGWAARTTTALVIASLLTPGLAAQGQTASQATAAAPQVPSLNSGDLARIKKALSQPPAIDVTDSQLRFYLDVWAKWPSFTDFLRTYDMTGPAKNSVMSHQDFLNMVTPKQLYGSGGFSASELLQAALVNVGAQAALKKGFQAIRDARNQQALNAIRAQIDRELNALKGG
jgi:hypothetical protein